MSTSSYKLPLFLVLLVFCGLILFGWPSSTSAKGEVTVEASILNVRSGPGLNYEVIGQVSQSENYQVLETKDNWYKIRISSNDEGWVAGWLVNYKVSTDPVKLVKSAVDVLNVRSGPGTSFQVLTQINPEQTFPLVKKEGDWVQIQLNDQETAWVAAWLVDINEGSSTEASQIRQKATVQATILNVRSGPSTSHERIGQLQEGEQIRVIEVKEGWFKIAFEDTYGWVAGDYIEQAELPSSSDSADVKKRVQVLANVLNVRSSGSLEADVIDQLTKGMLVEVSQLEGDWIKILYQDQEGWVANWLVEKVAPQLSNQPQVTILNQGTNLRKGPGTNFDVVDRADQGETFNVVGTEGDWFQIVLENGSKAYVAGWIVSAEGVPDVQRRGIQQYIKGKQVVIDPGHGGRDHGATGSHFNTLEKVVNLQVSNLLKSKFEAAGANVVLTRTSDRYISLQERIHLSMQEKADVFLSVHHNTNANSNINGTITYFYTNGRDRQLASLVQRETVKYNGLRDLKARKGNFFVLRENPRLAVLIELGFLSNYGDELAIRTNQFQENSAKGIFYGVATYFKDEQQQ